MDISMLQSGCTTDVLYRIIQYSTVLPCGLSVAEGHVPIQ